MGKKCTTCDQNLLDGVNRVRHKGNNNDKY